MSDNLNELLFAFNEHMKVRNYAQATMTGYNRELRKFLEHLRAAGITDIKAVSKDMLTTFQVSLMEHKARGAQGYTCCTVALKIRSVKRFFEFLESANQILINPAEYLKEPKKEYRLPRVILTEVEVRKILDQPNLSTRIGIRDRTVLEVFYSTGIRLEELVNLTIYDCDLQGGMLRVNKGKFAKDRVVPLGRHAVKFLKEYITHVRPYFTKKIWSTTGQRILFLNKFGSPLSTQVSALMIRGYSKAAGLNKKVTAHVFRHTFATQLVRNGADITAVQKMLGHSDLRVTQIYTRVAGVEVKRTHKDHHPREKDKAAQEDIAPHISMIRGHYNNGRS
jgi:integrase/recombinase XerD